VSHHQKTARFQNGHRCRRRNFFLREYRQAMHGKWEEGTSRCPVAQQLKKLIQHSLLAVLHPKLFNR
jgi:hypothetical protein